MDPKEQAELHVLLLQMLRRKGDLGRTEDALLNDVRLTGGFDLDIFGLQQQLRVLANEKRWIIQIPAELALKRWRITDLGTSKLAEAGL